MAARTAPKPERPVGRRNTNGVNGEFDGPRSAGDASDESAPFEPDQHGIDLRGVRLNNRRKSA